MRTNTPRFAPSLKSAGPRQSKEAADMDNENRSCIDCGSAACRGKGGQFPPFCRTEHLDEALLERSLEI